MSLKEIYELELVFLLKKLKEEMSKDRKSQKGNKYFELNFECWAQVFLASDEYLKLTSILLELDNKELAKEVVAIDGRLLHCLAYFRRDEDVVFEAVKNHPLALKYAMGPALLNKKIIITAIEKDRAAYEYVKDYEKIKWDNDITHAFIRSKYDSREEIWFQY